MSKFDVLKTAVTSKTARQLLLAKKYSPQILFGAGVIGMVGTVVLACKATLRLDDALQVADDQKAEASEAHMVEAMTEEDYKKRLRAINLSVGLNVAREYAPAVGMGLLTVGAFGGAQYILHRRNAGLAAIAIATQKALNEYRDRVRNELGEEKEREFAYGVEEVETREKLADGTEKIDIQKRPDAKFGSSPYAVMFDAQSHHFTKAPGGNRDILASIQQHMNDKLRARGHLFLNEVLDALDLKRTKAGSQVGWIWDPNKEIQDGVKRDSYVSFGIYENPDTEWLERFEQGRESEILLDFNVDGPIYHMI